jgi:pseudomonalisin
MRSGKVCALLLFVLSSSLMSWPQALSSPGAGPGAGPVRDLLSVRPTDRILAPVANGERVVLVGQRHPWAKPEYSIGRVAPDLQMERMVLVLAADPAQDAALEELIRAQHDPDSPDYHHWLTPAQFGKRFGVSQHDLDQVMTWLQGYGFDVDEVAASHRTMVFSGTAAQVESAFHTTIRHYVVQGVRHYANASNPEIPRALAPVVRGVVSLHDFRSAPTHVVAPQYTANGAHFVMPQDWAIIYDVVPLYAQGLDGTGQSIAILGRVDVALSDVRTFRANAGLPPHDPQMIINGPDPGFSWCDDELESAMDVEWAGAIADNAVIKFVTSKSGASDGITLSAQYAVNHNVAPVVSLSYGLCEAALGAAGNAFWNGTWAQAAAQGMSVFVSSGDGGAAGCDSPAQKSATQGRAVNGLCSSPYSTCVGGTQFNDAYNPGQYWSATNGAGQSSALGYIPESAWNESGWTGGLWAGGGGASIVYSKPRWQAAPGVPADGRRDVPDVALHASIQDAYVLWVQGKIFYASGTSAAAPSLASVMALVNEHAGAAQGNANPVFYALANQQLSANGAAVFHDIASGNNSVPGVTGFSAGAGYDAATGLGSVDASVLVNHWKDGSNSNFTLTPNVASISVAAGSSAAATITLTAQGGFASPVTLTASGMATGVTVRFSSSTLTAAAPVTATISAVASGVAGSSTVTITGTGGGLTRTASIAATVVIPTFALTANPASATVISGRSTTFTLNTSAINGFRSAITLAVSGLPKGATTKFAPASIAVPGTGSSTLTVMTAATTPSGTYPLTVTGSGGGVTKTQALSVTVTVPSFTLTLGGTKVIVARGGSIAMRVTTAASIGFSSPIALSVSGLPKGITASFAPATVVGGGNSTLTVKASSTAAVGTSTVTVTAAGGGMTRTQPLALTVQ